MRIGELARQTGVSVRALRYYEEQGLLVPDRRPNGYRDYPEKSVERVAQIQVLYSAGLCSGKIAELLPCIHSDGERVVAGAGLAGELEWELGRIQDQIDRMQSSLRILEGILASARSGSSEASAA